MPLGTEQIESVYVEVQRLLRAAGLGWVVEQVAEEVRLGVPESREVEVYKEVRGQPTVAMSADARPNVRRSKKAKFDSVREVSESEKLRWLLDATEEAVVRSAMIEQALVTRDGLLSKHDIGDIAFASDESVSHRVNAPEAAARMEAAAVVKGLLDELRGAI